MSSSQTSSEDLPVPHQRLWSDLHIHSLTLIADHLTTSLDVARFAGVCSTWKAASYMSHLHASKQFPWIQVSERKNKKKPCCGKFHIFLGDTGMDITDRFNIPLAAACDQHCVGSGAGWLVMRSMDEQITMLRPITGKCMPLPPPSTMHSVADRPSGDSNRKVRFKVLISKIVIGKDNDGFKVAVAIVGDQKLTMARPGDLKWATIQCEYPISDAIYQDERIYAVTTEGMLMTCNVVDKVEKMVSPPMYSSHGRQKRYIVVSMSGSLLQIVREYDNKFGTKSFTIFELLHEDQWLPVKDLGDQALFVGLNTSESLKAPGHPRCEANCIYFIEDNINYVCGCGRYTLKYKFENERKCRCGWDTGKYRLEDGSLVNTYFAGVSPFSPPLWYVPRLEYNRL